MKPHLRLGKSHDFEQARSYESEAGLAPAIRLDYRPMGAYLQLLRPTEWMKNVFVFAALAFGNRLSDTRAVILSIIAFWAFCFASSAGYVLNDILDCERDRLHPTKKNRPLPSGAIGTSAAWVMVVGLVLACAGLCVLSDLPTRFWWTVGAYLVLTWSYSIALKHRMILDVIVIAVLFVLRAVAGAVAICVPFSPWLVVCTFMLCMFLGFGKRRCEVAMLVNNEALRGHRPTLVRYTPDLLTHLLSTSAGMAILTFVLYTLDSAWPSPFGASRHNLIYTLPLVVYGVWRYAMLIELGKGTGPAELILKDPPFLAAIVLWILAAMFILYMMPASWGLSLVG